MENVINKETADKMMDIAAFICWQVYYRGRKLSNSNLADVNDFAREMFEGYCDYHDIDYENIIEVKES